MSKASDHRSSGDSVEHYSVSMSLYAFLSVFEVEPISAPLSAATCSYISSSFRAGVSSLCCLALDSSSSSPCPAFLDIAKSVPFICRLTHTQLPKLLPSLSGEEDVMECRTSSTILNTYGESGQPYLVPNLSGNALSFSPFNLMFAVGLLSQWKLEKVPTSLELELQAVYFSSHIGANWENEPKSFASSLGCFKDEVISSECFILAVICNSSLYFHDCEFTHEPLFVEGT
ncbi:hypothetical protein STEG23_002143 [Scotinomys teguina]